METAIVLGTFDGLHPGHRAVISAANEYHTVAVTFAIPPKAFFDKETKLIMMPSDKETGLKALGVREVCSLDFATVANIPPEDFLLWLKEKFSPSLIVCGFNYRFGKGASGGVDTLSRFCAQNGIAFKCAMMVGEDKAISSSSIRALIENGDIEAANRQIYGGFGFTASVLHGDARGTDFGFPTANQRFPEKLVRPMFGVYESRIIIDGTEYAAITNVGVRPTYKTDFIGCETFIKDFCGKLYGKNATLKFKRFIRKEKKFENADLLKAAVKADIKCVLGVEI